MLTERIFRHPKREGKGMTCTECGRPYEPDQYLIYCNECGEKAEREDFDAAMAYVEFVVACERGGEEG
jgi:Zn finger protein HypA/HybF involved in hydrogenase expression